MKKLSSLFILACCWLLCFEIYANYGNPYRPKADLLRDKGYEIKYGMKYFMQTDQYDMDGNLIEDTTQNTFSLIDNDLSLSYGFGNSLEFIVSGRVRNLGGTKTVGTQEYAPKKTGVESLHGEVIYGFKPFNDFKYAASIFYRQTLYSHNKGLVGSFAADTIELGDDGSEYGAGLLFSKGSKGWLFDGELQFVSPANNLASEVRYQLGVNYKSLNWALLSGIEGIKSIGDDEYSSAPATKPVSASANYTSLFDSINHSYMKPYLGVNYAFKSFMIGARLATIMAPVSTDAGHEVLFTVTTQSIGETEEKAKVESFKDYTIDGSVLKVSGRGNFIKIDQGLQSDVEKGKAFDIYQTDYFGGNELVAEGVVYEVGSDWSVIKLTKKYKKVDIRPGFAARGN